MKLKVGWDNEFLSYKICYTQTFMLIKATVHWWKPFKSYKRLIDVFIFMIDHIAMLHSFY